MDIKFGIENTPREVTVEMKSASSDLVERISSAISSKSLLQLEDRKGNTVLIPGAKIAYVELGSDGARPVGFGAL